MDGKPHKKWVYFLIYDNSQKNTPYILQRHGASSRFVKITAMLYLEVVMYPSLLNLKWPHTIQTPINYYQQAIPSVPNMNHYELTMTTPLYLLVMDSNSNSSISNDNNLDVDFGGTRVAQYIKHLRQVCEFKSQRIFMSRYVDYSARPKVYEDNKGEVNCIFTALNKLRTVDGLYERAQKWQENTCSTWKVEQPKAKIIGLPAVKGDETTLVGTGGVVIKSLLLTEII